MPATIERPKTSISAKMENSLSMLPKRIPLTPPTATTATPRIPFLIAIAPST